MRMLASGGAFSMKPFARSVSRVASISRAVPSRIGSSSPWVSCMAEATAQRTTGLLLPPEPQNATAPP